MLCKKTKKTVRTRHYTGGKFYLKIRWWKILGGTFWCKSFGGQHGKNRNHSKFVTAFPASFRPKNSSDCKEVLLNEIGGSRPFAATAKKLLGVWRCPFSFAITRCHVIFEIPCLPKIYHIFLKHKFEFIFVHMLPQ